MAIESSSRAGVNGMQTSPEVEATATVLAKENSDSDPALEKIYLFPNEDEARLVYVDSTTAPIRPGEHIAPFYFSASPKDGLTSKSAMAIIAPEDDQNGALPESWGTWENAILLWERNGG
jgi:hypothetical protein